MNTVSREELERRLPNAPTRVLDELEGKTEAEVDEFIDDARYIQSLPDDLRRKVDALVAFYHAHPLRAEALLSRRRRGHVTFDQIVAEALKWAESAQENAS